MMAICDDAGIPTDALLPGLPFDRAHLEDPKNFIDWESLTIILERLTKYLSEEDFLNLAVASYRHPMYALYRVIGRLRFNLVEFYLYLFGPAGATESFYPISSELIHFDPLERELTFEVRLAPGLKPSLPFFRILEGQAIGITEVMGYGKASVKTHYEDNCFTLWIKLPKETGLFPLLRKTLLFPLDLWSSGKILQLTHDTLVKRNRELEEEKAQLSRARAFLRVQKEQLDLVKHNQNMMFWTLDLDLKPHYYSESVFEMTGYTAEEAVQQPGLWFIHDDSKEVAINTLARYLELEKQEPFLGSVSTRLKIQRKDNATFWAQAHTSFLRSDHGEAVGLVGVTIDIEEQMRTEQRQKTLEMELAESRQRELVGRVAGGIAHDFNNSLQTIIGYSEMSLNAAEHGPLNSSDIIRNNQQILKAATSASELVRQLLALGRRQTLKFELIDLAEWLKEASTMIDPIIDSNIELTIDVPSGLTVRADPIQLERVLANLTVNAKDAMPGGGTFLIRGRHHADRIELSFSDSGSGIPESILDHIFEPFFTSKNLNQGSGLGLAVSAGIIEQHQGEISAKSIEGEGTTINITLPFVVSEARPDKTPETMPPEISGSYCILVVDDRDVIRDLIGSMLRREPIEILEARNGIEAVELFSTHKRRIDLVLMDIVMPGQNGDVAAEKIKQQKPNIPIVFMTGYAGDLADPSAIQEQAVLAKPFTRHELLRTLGENLPDHHTPGVNHTQI